MSAPTCCGPGYVCEPYPSVIRRMETGCDEQPIVYKWVAIDDGNHGPHGDSPHGEAAYCEIFGGLTVWLLGDCEDESPDDFPSEAEAIDALWRIGPPTCRRVSR